MVPSCKTNEWIGASACGPALPRPAVQDAAIIDNSVAKLSAAHAVALLELLVERLQHHPQQAARLAPWLRSLLLAHGPALATAPAGQVRQGHRDRMPAGGVGLNRAHTLGVRMTPSILPHLPDCRPRCSARISCWKSGPPPSTACSTSLGGCRCCSPAAHRALRHPPQQPRLCSQPDGSPLFLCNSAPHLHMQCGSGTSVQAGDIFFS